MNMGEAITGRLRRPRNWTGTGIDQDSVFSGW
jgi:hypothetical protein